MNSSAFQLPVVYVLDGSPAITGAFKGARHMAQALRQRAEVVLVIADNARFPVSAFTDFAAVRRIPMRQLRRSVWSLVQYLPALLWSSWQLARYMVRDGASLLLVNDFYLMHGVLAKRMGFRGRVITWVRIDPTRFGIIARVWLWAARRTSDKIVAVSRFVQRQMPNTVPTVVLYDAAQPASGFAVPRATSPDNRIFVYIGNYVKGKGQDVALEALARVVPEFPAVRVHFYGGNLGLEKNHGYRERLVQHARTLDIAQHVEFHGFADHPAEVLAQSFAAINFSRSESFSMTVLEASAAGLPVVASRSGGPEEIVEEGITGLLVPVGDVAACAEAMRWLCRHPERACAMGEAGRAHVSRAFSADTFQRELIELLELDPAVRPAA